MNDDLPDPVGERDTPVSVSPGEPGACGIDGVSSSDTPPPARGNSVRSTEHAHEERS